MHSLGARDPKPEASSSHSSPSPTTQARELISSNLTDGASAIRGKCDCSTAASYKKLSHPSELTGLPGQPACAGNRALQTA